VFTRESYIKEVLLLGRIIKKPYEKMKNRDLDEFIISLLENGYSYPNRKGKYKQTRIEHLKIVLGEFFKSIKKETVVKDLKPRRLNNFKLPEDIWTKEEVIKIVSSADNFRDKALIFSLYESACRKGEWMNIKIKNITLDEYGAVIVVSGKTGSRRVRLLDSVPDLTSWLNQHPDRDNPEAPLWINYNTYIGRPMGFNGLLRVLRLNANRVEIKKRINPHLLRHSRLTHLAGMGFTEAELRIIAGWSASSKMPRVYIHLSGADVDRKLLEKAGVIKDDKKENGKTSPKECAVCGESNSVTNKFCKKCGKPLDLKTVMAVREDETILKEFLEKNEGMFVKFLREKKVSV
jgi:integrase